MDDDGEACLLSFGLKGGLKPVGGGGIIPLHAMY